MTDINLLRQWFSIAESDLRVAKHTYENVYPKPLAISCFHCQQAAEKALKGYLQYREVDPLKIHGLTVLCQQCSELDPSFDTVLEAASKLTPYGVASRYPAEIVIDENMTKTAIARAQTVYDFSLSKIPELNG
jgi:HEPN domain-containing protein